MLKNITYLQSLANYNIWANNLVISWLQQISEEDWQKDLGGSMPSIATTVIHIAGAEKIWFERLNNEVSPFLTTYFKGNKEEIIEIWETASQNLSVFLSKISIEKLEEVFEYKNLAGDTFSSKKIEALAHVFNHSTYHRGQIVNYLRQIGFNKLSSTDLINYYRSL